jgi:antibiotic biosynthesis monooxygenase (ABM) superfamily enzyme
MKISQNMKMVFGTIYNVQVTVFVSDYPGYIGVQLLRVIPDEGRNTVLCPENKMVQQLPIA